MGSINYGNQDKSFDFKAQGRASVFNKINQGLHPTGIYSGFELTKVDDTTVTVSPGVAFIEDALTNNGIGIRVKTTASQNVHVTTLNTYIVLRMTWSNSLDNNYMDMLTVPRSSVEATDIIVGRCEYIGATLQTTFDLTERKTSPIQKLVEDKNNLQLKSNDPYTNTVTITAGYYTINDVLYYYDGTVNSPTFPSVSNGIISYVLINASGIVSIVNSTDIESPSKPVLTENNYIIGYITRLGATNEVRGSQITNVNKEVSFVNGITIDNLEVTNDIALNGNITSKITSTNTTDASSSDGAIRTAGGISADKGGTFSGLLTAANFKTGSSSGNITNTGTGGIGGCISILGTVSLNTSTTDPSAISIGNNSTAEGRRSTALGSSSTASGTSSTAFGRNSTASGEYSTALGHASAASVDYSTALGVNSSASGSSSTALGVDSSASGARSTALGFNASAAAGVSNYIKIGDANANIYTQKAINVISDKRDKTNIEDNDLGLDFINAIRTVKYNQNSRENYYKKDEDGKLLRDKKGHRILDEEAYRRAELKSKRKYRGVIAQEVEKLWDTMDFSAVHHTIHNYEDAEDQYSVNYEQFIPVLIKAVQELSEKNDELTAEIEFLKLS